MRDTIMGKTPHDYDIATNARPEEVKKLFRRTIDTGIKHGTVTVVTTRQVMKLPRLEPTVNTVTADIRRV